MTVSCFSQSDFKDIKSQTKKVVDMLSISFPAAWKLHGDKDLLTRQAHHCG